MTLESKKISDFSVILVFVFFTIIGLALISYLPVKLAPSQELPQININFSMYGSSPAIVEMEATSKLEAMLGRLSGVRKISSNSGNGWGNISIQLDRHVDPASARFEVSSIIRQAWSKLPDNISYPTVSLRNSDDKAKKNFLSYSLVAPASPIVIQQYAENIIKTRLSDIDGLNQINVSGANPMEWQLEYDYKQLERLKVSVSEIQGAINQYLKNESIGLVSFDYVHGKHNQFIPVSITPPFYNDAAIEDMLKQIEIKKTETNRIIRLADVVSIRRAESQPTGYYRINGHNTIYITMMAEEIANQLELAKKVKERLLKIQEDFPAGYSIQKAYDATDYIKEELNKIYFRAGLTILILLIFVVLVYRKLKYTLLIVLSLVMCLAISSICYYLLGIEIQLYSLAGITISLTLIIDNIIVLSDQIINRGNKKAFLAILAASVTTIGALTIIFFLEEKIRLNLRDFAVVIMINLSVSLLVSLFLVPALINKLKIENKVSRKKKLRRASGVKALFKKLISLKSLSLFNRIYTGMIRFMWRWKIAFFALIILLFGLPVFMLPDKIEKDNRFAQLYNNTLGSEFYKEKLKTHVNNILGGTWRLFVQKVYNGSYFESDREETSLFITATLPNGSTLTHMNNLIQGMETYIAEFEGVSQFETNVYSANRAGINIRFTKAYQRSGFPHQLKSKLISKSLELGGGSWSVYGVGDGFSNDIREGAGSYRIVMFGFNYDELYAHAEKLKEQLLGYRRIKEVTIDSEFSWYKDDYQEFNFELNHERMAKEGVQPYQLFAAIKPVFEKGTQVARIANTANTDRIMLRSKQSGQYNVWDMQHIPVKAGDKEFKLSELLTIEKYQAPQKISKENQQYRLCLQYEYIGAYEQGRKVLENEVESYRNDLPVGYSVQAEENHYGWGKSENKQYWLLGIVFLIIYLCSGILFNSLRQPFHIIFIIPLSFIGIFLSFYWFKINFDQGGFAAFIVLSGLTVNANIYIINEYNNILESRHISPLEAYIKAWNAKVRPVFLTVFSTIIGFTPFIIGYKESFWFPLAVGTIGGLIVSFVVMFLFLPLFLVGKKIEQTN
jgi:multidrug efflux pump subunit AcrB